ncbi:MAG: LapA family protein [Burkholderiales bacterium]
MRVFVWLIRAAVFFTLFAFALNNRDETVVRWFFGYEWRAPMVFVVLAVFALGCAFGVFAMVPSWWRHRRVARKHAPVIDATPAAPATTPAREITLNHPPRDGL